MKAEKILQDVSNCATRLRVIVKDSAKVDDKFLYLLYDLSAVFSVKIFPELVARN